MKRFFIIALFCIGLLMAVPVNADSISEQHIFSIDAGYDFQGRSQINATLRLISPHAYIYIADDYWTSLDPAGQSELNNLAAQIVNEFDTRIYPTETQFFGSEPNPGIDNDTHLTLILTRLKYNVGGYFDSSNEYAKKDLAVSNEREMIYLNAAQFTQSQRLFPFLAHEFQHLISFNQKEQLRNVSDDTWLNEARSEYAISLLGYNANFPGSTLEHRMLTFLQQPSDSLTEWKNLIADYGQIDMFDEYLAEHWLPKVIADTLPTSAIGVASINEALAKNGYRDTFEDVFLDWMVANVLNDTSKNPLFGYMHPGLKNFRVQPTPGVLNIQANFQPWEQHWYDFRVVPALLRVTITAPSGFFLRVPYVAIMSDGTQTLQLADVGTHGEVQIQNTDGRIVRVILMPYVQPETTISNPEMFNLHEGDFIRAEGDKDVFIINEFGYKRIVLSPKICLLYQHLGARGCFGAVHVVPPATRDAFVTSSYYSNGETNDGKVYRLVETGEDSAYLQPSDHPLDHEVFFINTQEQQSY